MNFIEAVKKLNEDGGFIVQEGSTVFIGRNIMKRILVWKILINGTIEDYGDQSFPCDLNLSSNWRWSKNIENLILSHPPEGRKVNLETFLDILIEEGEKEYSSDRGSFLRALKNARNRLF